MVANYDSIKNDTESYVNEVCSKLPIDKVYLFGSYAKGTADELSDVDIAFFVKDFQNRTRIELGMELLKLTHNYKPYFEPLIFPSSELTRDNPFIKEIIKTGLEIKI